MKVHFEVVSVVSPHYQEQAEYSWQKDGLIPYREKLCSGLMMKKENSEFLTTDRKNVTCKKCLLKIERGDDK